MCTRHNAIYISFVANTVLLEWSQKECLKAQEDLGGTSNNDLAIPHQSFGSFYILGAQDSLQ